MVPWLAFERLIDRPTLVSFKFVPTQKADIARWYRLVRWRKAVFEGDCGRTSEHPADYLVTLNVATLARVAVCGDIVWTNGTYGVVRIASLTESERRAGISNRISYLVSFTFSG